MNFQQLEYVIEVHRCGSINKAAQMLFLSQPALSSAVKDLETELGFPLFVRNSKGITTTVEGDVFIDAAKQIVDQMRKIQGMYKDESDESSASILKISSGRYSFIAYALIMFYNNYFKDRSKFAIHVEESNCQQVVADVFNRKSEIGIIHVCDGPNEKWQKELEEKGLDYKFLFYTHSCIILRKGHPLTYKKNLTFDDIFVYPQTQTVGRDTPYNSFDSHAGGFPYYERSTKNIFTNNRNFLYNYLTHTDAIFLGITDLAVSEMHPELTVIPIPGMDIRWKIYYVKIKNQNLSANANLFIDIIRKNSKEADS